MSEHQERKRRIAKQKLLEDSDLLAKYRKAWILKRQGVGRTQIARLLGVSSNGVRDWFRAIERDAGVLRMVEGEPSAARQ